MNSVDSGIDGGGTRDKHVEIILFAEATIVVKVGLDDAHCVWNGFARGGWEGIFLGVRTTV